MKCLRLILVMIMSVAIPVNGFAAAPVSPCPMLAAGHITDISEAAVEVDMSMDCCEDMHKQPQGKCKTGQSCSMGGVYFALPVAFQIFPPVSIIALAHYAAPHFSEPTASIWHPPQRA
ncbi:MAG: hypothetical protein ACYC4K_07385 [Thiobacillus sp.]